MWWDYGGTGMDACPMWPNQSAHPRRPPIAMQRRAANDLSALAACQFQTSSCGPSHSRDAMARAVAVLGELAQPQGHCRAPQRATDLPGGSIPGRWIRAPRAAHRILGKEALAYTHSILTRADSARGACGFRLGRLASARWTRRTVTVSSDSVDDGSSQWPTRATGI
eukprot:scaffold13303_cov70-Phaeocystis_antarctica.AAC.6